MEYQQIGGYEKVSALNERIRYLEQGHYSNEVYLIEAHKIGDTETITKLTGENRQLDQQWAPLVEERDRILEELEKANPIEEENNEGQLRGEPGS